MFESERAASSRLRFISQLAGGAAGMSLLAACGGATSSSSGSGLLVPGSPMLAVGAGANNALRLADTPELQALLAKSGHYAVQQGSVAVIRDDMKSNGALVSKIGRQVAAAKAKMQRRSGLHPQEDLGDDGDGDGYYDDVPEYTIIKNVSTTYLDDYPPPGGDYSQYGAILDPFDGFQANYGPIFTVPAWLQNCGEETKDSMHEALLAMAEYVIGHSSTFGKKLTTLADLFTGDFMGNLEFLIEMFGSATVAEWLELLVLVGLVGWSVANYISCAKRYGWQ